jgi:hypothetical protein
MARDDKTITVPLKSGVTVGKTEIHEIKLREPTGRDVREAGVPLIFSADGTFRVDAQSMAAMVARLSDHSLATLDELSVGDWMRCQEAVLPFFGEEAPTAAPSSGDASTSPGSGD